MRPLLYYVHHHGSGHWRRALAVAAQLDRPVVFASSAPAPSGVPCTTLPMDAPAPDRAADQATAGGHLHWAPPGQAGLLARHRELLTVALERDVAAAVVDVSAEVSILLRTSGIPVIAVRLPGDRDDAAHRLGFGLAGAVVMPVPASWGLHEGLSDTHAVGLIGRAPTAVPRPAGPPRLVIVVGQGGSRIDGRLCTRIAGELPEYDVRVLGLAGAAPGLTFLGRVPDPRAELHAATVVVGNAGLGTVSDVAQAGKPFVVLPEPRPFGEQHATAQALSDRGEAVCLWEPPGSGGWAAAVAAARTLTPSRYVDGAPRFAALIEEQIAATSRELAVSR